MHQVADGGVLAVYTMVPADRPARGTIVLTHGLGEHAGRYAHVAARLASMGLRVISWDLRGHGRSSGRRGDIASYEVLIEDLRAVVALAEAGNATGTPIFLHGHSTGAQMLLIYAAKRRPPAAGLIITSPWFRLAFEPSRFKVLLARIAAHVWPQFTQNTELVPARLSQDLEFLKSLPNPELVHHRMSARMYRALMEGAAIAAREGISLRYPTLYIHGANDPVTSVDATREFFDQLQSKDKTLIIVPDAVHETHNDLARESVITDICAWIEARL